jgi:hypothetical protein
MGTDRASVLIGVDGGATEVRAYEVEVASLSPELTLRLGRWNQRRVYEEVRGFVPRPLEKQRAQVSDPLLSVPEYEQGLKQVAATAECIEHIFFSSGAPSARVAIAMPGLKSADRRGISLSIRNGPRIPNFLDRLEERLTERQVRLEAPIRGLLDVGTCCGLGEEHGPNGLFRGVRDAYYIGGGTGVAEALKLGGELVDWARVETWLPKAWQMRSKAKGFDERLSIAEFNARFASMPPRAHRHDGSGFPEDRVEEDPCARGAFEDLARELAELVQYRVRSLAGRSPEANEFAGPIRLERVVVGQRLGQLYGDPRTRPFFRTRTEDLLKGLRQRLLPPADRKARALPVLLVASNLRAAPAIGAAASAILGR